MDIAGNPKQGEKNDFRFQTDDDWLEYYALLRQTRFGTNLRGGIPDGRENEIEAWFQYQYALYRDKKLPAGRQKHFEYILKHLNDQNEERRSLISELRPKNLKRFLRLIPKKGQDQINDPTAVTKWLRLIPELGRKNQDKIDSEKGAPHGEMNGLNALNSEDATREDRLRSKYADQTDDEWFQYYLWCKESANAGGKILANVPNDRKKDVEEWLEVHWALYRDGKLSARRHQLFQNLLYSKSR